MLMRILAIVIGVALLGAGIASIMFIQCPNKAQAFGMIVMLALGAGLLLFGFLQVFHLNITVSGVTAAGAAAVFVLIYLVKPTAMTDISCISYALPLRVVDAVQPTTAVPKAIVMVRGSTTERVEMNANGEGSLFFSDAAVGEEVNVWATATGFKDGTPTKVTLAKQMKVVELPLQAIVGARPTPVNGSTVPTVGGQDAPTNPFRNVFATKTEDAEVRRMFASRFCLLGIIVNELRNCTYETLAACETQHAAAKPGPYKSNHKCVTREELMFCYAQQTQGFTGGGRPQCYPDLPSCQASVQQLAGMSAIAQPSGPEVCQPFRV
jgi:hypothetical protein